MRRGKRRWEEEGKKQKVTRQPQLKVTYLPWNSVKEGLQKNPAQNPFYFEMGGPMLEECVLANSAEGCSSNFLDCCNVEDTTFLPVGNKRGWQVQIELMSALCSSGKSTFRRQCERPQYKRFDKNKRFNKITHQCFILMISENTTSGASQGLLRVDAALLCMTCNEQKKNTRHTLSHCRGSTYILAESCLRQCSLSSLQG